MRRVAFTVSKLEGATGINSTLESLDRARKSGMSFKEWKNTVNPEDFISDAHAKTVFNNHMGNQINSGTYLKGQTEKSDKPYFYYVAILDDVVRPEHAAMHGIIRKVDDAFWNQYLPLNGHNCRCTVRQLTANQAVIRRRAARKSQNRILEKEGKKKLPQSRTISTSPAEIRHLRKNLKAIPDKGFSASKTRSPIQALDKYAKSRLKVLPPKQRAEVIKKLKQRDEAVNEWFKSQGIKKPKKL